MSLLGELEDEFDIDLESENPGHIVTIRDAVEMLEKLL